MTNEENYYNFEQENVVHDVFLMIQSDRTEYETVEDVLLAETTFTENALGFSDE
jgi:hypothetical protein